MFLGALDMGIVSPALPGIARGLKVAPASAMAVVTLYYLAYAAAMPLLGKLGDRWGTGRMLRAGLLAFGVGSLLAAAAPSLGWLLAGRVLQAVGGGGVVPVAVAAVARRAPPARRGRALGLVGAVFGVAGVLGPNLGGLVLAVSSWRWIFLLNLPLAAAAWSGTWRLESRRAAGRSLDWAGAGGVTLGVGGLLYAVMELGGHPLLSGGVLLPAGVGVAGLAWLGRSQPRAVDPVVPPRFLGEGRGVLAAGILAGILMSAMALVPLYLQDRLGLSAPASGYGLTPMAVAAAVCAGMGGVLVDRFGPRSVLTAGFAGFAAGYALLFWGGTGLGVTMLGLALAGLGTGLSTGAPLNYLALEVAGGGREAAGTAVISLARTLGASMGPALLALFLAAGREFQAAAALGLVGTVLALGLSGGKASAGGTGSQRGI